MYSIQKNYVFNVEIINQACLKCENCRASKETYYRDKKIKISLERTIVFRQILFDCVCYRTRSTRIS